MSNILLSSPVSKREVHRMLMLQMEDLMERLLRVGSFFNLHGNLDRVHPGAPVVAATLMMLQIVSRLGSVYQSGRVVPKSLKGFSLLNKLLMMRLRIVDSSLEGLKLSVKANASRMR
jgi:hypothetical protein